MRHSRHQRIQALHSAFIAALLVGCGGGPKFTGTLCETCGNGPTPAAGAPVVTSLSPSSVTAGGPGFTLTVTGTNFTPGMTVGGIDTTSTTFVSSTEMQAQVPASAIATPGSVTVIAVTSPPSTLNFGTSFTIADAPVSGNTGFTILNVPIQANDMVWDPTSEQIYLSVPGTSGTNANTITALNPATGVLGVSQAAGSGPDRLALSSDGTYLYAGLDGVGLVQRFTLPGLGKDIAISLGSLANFGPYSATDVEVSPASPHTIAVLRGTADGTGGIVIYDDAVARPTSVPGGYYVIPGTDFLLGTIDTILWKPDASTIYGSGYNYLDTFSVNSGGVQATYAYQSVYGGFGPVIHYDPTTGYLYSSTIGASGSNVIDPSTGKVVGTFPLNAIEGGFDFGSTAAMVTDGTLNIAYFLGHLQTTSSAQEYTLEAFDLTHYTVLGAISVPNVVGTPVKLIRWGTNGLAFLTQTRDTNNGTTSPGAGDGVYLISGAFVTSPAAQARRTQGVAQ